MEQIEWLEFLFAFGDLMLAILVIFFYGLKKVGGEYES